MKEITFNKEVLEIVNRIGELKSEILFLKENDSVVFRQRGEGSIYTHFKTNLNNFDFEGDSLAFIDYRNFYKFLKLFKEPKLKQNENKLVIYDSKSKLNYCVSDPRVIIKSTFETITLPQSDINFLMGEADFNGINQLIKLVGGDNVRFTFEGNSAFVTLFKDGYDNSYERTIDINTNVKDKIEIEMKSSFFELAPCLPYNVNVVFKGSDNKTVFDFGFDNGLYSVNFYTKERNDR